MKTVNLFTGCFIFLLISCSSGGNQTKEEKEKASYEQMKKDLLEKEEKNPTLFLTVSGNNKKNVIGQTVIKGKITSAARMAVFKDIDLKIDFYSETKALLESDSEILYIEVKPGSSQSFKTKYFAPKGTDSVALSIKSAKIIEQ